LALTKESCPKNREEVEAAGFENTKQIFAGWEIWRLGNEYVLVDPDTGVSEAFFIKGTRYSWTNLV